MVEPEVLMDGDHDIETCFEVTEVVLRSLFDALFNQSVMLEGTILKASMVVSGKGCDEQASVDEVAESTLMCLKSSVPAILPGIVFLSGGQSEIGRASCRERVCQYVSISVVAVSLKKKK